LKENPMATVQTAANTISVVLPFLSSLTGAVTTATHTPPAVADKIQASLAGVQQGVAALAASETAVQSQPIMARIAADAQAVLTVAAGLPLPPPFNIILMIASSLLPSVVSAVNLLIATKTTVPSPAP
jgi:hypothetical protein